MIQITSIPDHVKSQFPSIIQEAIHDGLSCEPADRTRAEKALRKLYALCKLDSTVPIVWVNNPIEGSKLVVRSTVSSAVNSAVNSAVSSAVSSAVLSAVSSAVNLAVNSAVYSAVYSAVHLTTSLIVFSQESSAWRPSVTWYPYNGQRHIQWPAFIQAIKLLGVDDPSFRAVELEHEIDKSCHCYWPMKDKIVVCERPTSIKKVVQGRLHNEIGPSIAFRGNFEVYCWHGTKVPKEWIMNKASLSAQEVLKNKNLEQRRAGCEIIGWSKIVEQLGAKVIDRHTNPEVGTLLEVDLPDSGKERFLQVKCGTKRDFMMAVPPTVKTALEGQAYMWDMAVDEFVIPDVRT